uniref:Secreted protein n=1 Tax=Globodera pallida TaxID=36090 RepID=A0A183CRC3_GLOPA
AQTFAAPILAAPKVAARDICGSDICGPDCRRHEVASLRCALSVRGDRKLRPTSNVLAALTCGHCRVTVRLVASKCRRRASSSSSSRRRRRDVHTVLLSLLNLSTILFATFSTPTLPPVR